MSCADHSDSFWFRRNRLGMAVGLAAILTTAGCGDGREAASVQKANAVTKPAVEAAPPDAVEEIVVTIDAAGRKWLTPEVPYDVFPGLPSDEEIAAATSSMTEAGAATVNMTGPAVASTDRTAAEPTVPPVDSGGTTQTSPSQGDPAAAPDSGWDLVLPLESFQGEIAAVRNDLGERLLTVGSYNEAFEQVAVDGWLMSALATIARDHSGSISWKDKSLLARDAAAAVATAATGRGRQNFNDARLANEQLVAVLNNNSPAGLEAPDETASREETADRAALMSRMQTAFDRLKGHAADEASLKKNLDAAAREARILAAIAKFTSHPDYGSADEPDYQTAAGEVISAGGAMADAAKAEDFATFQAAFDKVGSACARCHEKYRFTN